MEMQMVSQISHQKNLMRLHNNKKEKKKEGDWDREEHTAQEGSGERRVQHPEIELWKEMRTDMTTNGEEGINALQMGFWGFLFWWHQKSSN